MLYTINFLIITVSIVCACYFLIIVPEKDQEENKGGLKKKWISPFVPLLISTVGGVLVQSYVPVLFTIQIGIWITGVLCVFLTHFVFHKKVIYGVCIVFFLMGNLVWTVQQAHHDTILKLYENKNIDVIAHVTDKRICLIGENSRWSEIIELSVHKVSYSWQSFWSPAQFKLLCYVKSRTGLMVGDTIRCSSLVIKACIDKRKTFSNYLTKEGYSAALFLSHLDAQLIRRPAYSFVRFIWTKREEIKNRLKSELSAQAYNFVALIFLGNKETQDDSLRPLFNQWGLAHFLARAGLHVMLFIFLWGFLLHLLPVPLFFKRSFLVLLCVLYGLFSWTSVPFERALYVFLLIYGGRLAHKQTNFLHLLTFMCLLFVLLNPIQIYSLDFQLTYVLTFALVL